MRSRKLFIRTSPDLDCFRQPYPGARGAGGEIDHIYEYYECLCGIGHGRCPSADSTHPGGRVRRVRGSSYRRLDRQ